MDALTLTAACVLCAAQSTAPADVARWEPMIAQASARFAIPESWIARVMQAESAGRTMRDGKPITSPVGAMGLMQIMPDTYAELRRRYALGSNPYDPRDNILAGTAYLRAMYVRYGYPFLFAAYNAGPARFDDFLFRDWPLPHATFDYMLHIVPGGVLALETATAKPKSYAQIVRIVPTSRLFFFVSEASKVENPSGTRASTPPVEDAKSASIIATNNSTLFVPLTASPR